MRTPEQIMAGVRANVDHALGSAAVYLALQLREVVGVQAPLIPGYDPPTAATPAIPGAPPRMVSGALRSRIAVKHLSDGVWQVGVYGLSYPSLLEDQMGHPFMDPTVNREMGRMMAIVGQELQVTRAS